MTDNKQTEQSITDDEDDFSSSQYSEKYVIPMSIFEIDRQVHHNLYYISPSDMEQIKNFIAQAVKNRLKIRKNAKNRNKTETKKRKKQIPYIYKIDDVFVSIEDKKIEVVDDHPDG